MHCRNLVDKYSDLDPKFLKIETEALSYKVNTKLGSESQHAWIHI